MARSRAGMSHQSATSSSHTQPGLHDKGVLRFRCRSPCDDPFGNPPPAAKHWLLIILQTVRHKLDTCSIAMLPYAPEKRPPHKGSQVVFLRSQKDVITLMHDLRLGIDVGGTNTDAVVLDALGQVVAKAKTPTTAEVTTGIGQAIDLVLADGVPAQAIGSAMLGTTQCINAIFQLEHLGRVGVVRLGAPATLAIPPLTDWPEDLRSQVAHACYIVAGGHEFDGRETLPTG